MASLRASTKSAVTGAAAAAPPSRVTSRRLVPCTSCGPDGCGRGGGVGGVKEGAPPLPSRPPPSYPPPLISSDQGLRDGWARLSWVAPPPPRQTKQPLPHPHHTTFHLHLAKNKKLTAQSSLPLPSQTPPPTPTNTGCLPTTTPFAALKQYPTHHYTTHQQPAQYPTHHKLVRPFSKDSTPSSSSSSTLSLHHHHHNHPEDEGGLYAESRLVANSCSGSSAGSLNSTSCAAGSSTNTASASTNAPSTSATNMSSSTGAAASYSTIRRGLKATTSKLVNATSTIRRPTAGAVATVSDRQPGTEKNDPHRFVEGMSFKGKLIGVLEVSEARGDRMCQEALAELKMAVRAAGEHKQRIVVNVAMDGIRLRDERSSDCLYHHPVHKISFIAQDMTDNRAFGYIFGSPDAGHKFFGIKTEKAASQVVIAMRDLFQVVFELKKKEIEKARSQLEEGRERGEFRESSFGGLFGSNGDSGIEGEQFDPFGDSFKPAFKAAAAAESAKPRVTATTAPTPAPLAPPPFSGRTRHDSQQSQQGAQQKQQPSGAAADPKSSGSDEFAKFPVSFPDVTKSPLTTEESAEGAQSLEDRYAAFKEFRSSDNDSFNSFSESRFCEGQESQQASGASSLHQPDEFDVQWSKASFDEGALGEDSKESHYDVFTELDPLGTGKNRPYVDKRDFFSEMRKPVKRVLRELGDGEASAPCSPRTQPGMIPAEVSALVASTSLYATTPRPSSVTATQPATSTNTTPVHRTSLPSQQFAESFSPPDSFGQEDFQFHQQSDKDFYEVANVSSGFADFNTFPNDSPRSQRSEMSSSIPDEPPPPLPCGPLTVALPPESFRDSPPPFSPPPVPRSPARMASGPGSPQFPHTRHSPLPRARLTKQMMVVSSSISPKTLPRSHKFRNEASFDSDWDSREAHHRSFTSGELTPPTPPQQQSDGGISPRPRPRSHLTKQLSASSATLSLRPSHSRYGEIEQFSSPEGESRPFPTDDLNLSYEEAPKPPPRPAHIEPPPLPPKRQPTHVTLRPPPRPPPSSDPHYNYINEYDSSPDEANTPPIPIPARKPRYSESASRPAFIPSRASKPSHSDGFQFPKPSISPTHELTGAVPKSSRESTPSKSSTPGKSPRLTQKSTASVDLANTSLDQLASSLNMHVDQLARMTVVELAACLAQLQLRQGGDTENQARDDTETYALPDKSGRRSRGPTREQSRDRFAFEDDEMFAEFDAQFPKSPVEPPEYTEGKDPKVIPPVGAPVSEDRYAVFRELTTTVSKQRSVFDENFLTPQNSMEEEVSEVSSGTFKANFDGDLREDSLERKSSLSDDGDAAELEKDKNWAPPNHDLECVTVFRSPEISEYDNFEPTFDAKFDDDFSAATMSERSITPVNSPTQLRRGSPRSHKQQSENYKSPFTDDFSKQSVGSRSRVESDTSFASFDDNFVPPSDAEKCSSLQELSVSEKVKHQDSLRKSPFIDSFVDSKGREQVEDGRYSAGFGDTSVEKYDDPFTIVEPKPRSSSRSSSEMMSKTPDFDNSLQAPVDPLASKRKSPFDDDFTNRGDRYEVLKEVESEREPSLEGEVSRLTRQGDPRESPFDDSWHGSHRNTPYEDQKSIGSLHSTHEDHKVIPPESPFEDDFHNESRKASGEQGRLSRSGSENRKSPFGDSYTPPASGRAHRSRGPSRLSVGSEGSDVRHSPFEDNFSSIIGSVAEEVTFDNAFPSLPQDINTTSSEAEESDPFSVKVTKTSDSAEAGQSETTQFADFENAFQHSQKEESEQVPESQDQSVPEKNTEDGEDATEDFFPDDEPDFKVSARFIAPTSTDMKKSDSVSIFRRNSDPFADDFFCAEGENGIPLPPGKNENDPFWQEPFDNFSFPKDQ